jgi:hypothetical protein
VLGVKEYVPELYVIVGGLDNAEAVEVKVVPLIVALD